VPRKQSYRFLVFDDEITGPAAGHHRAPVPDDVVTHDFLRVAVGSSARVRRERVGANFVASL